MNLQEYKQTKQLSDQEELCPICKQQFCANKEENNNNNYSRIPRKMSQCGHSFCESCINEILNSHQSFFCPIDNILFVGKREIDSFPKDENLLEILSQKSSLSKKSVENKKQQNEDNFQNNKQQELNLNIQQQKTLNNNTEQLHYKNQNLQGQNEQKNQLYMNLKTEGNQNNSKQYQNKNNQFQYQKQYHNIASVGNLGNNNNVFKYDKLQDISPINNNNKSSNQRQNSIKENEKNISSNKNKMKFSEGNFDVPDELSPVNNLNGVIKYANTQPASYKNSKNQSNTDSPANQNNYNTNNTNNNNSSNSFGNSVNQKNSQQQQQSQDLNYQKKIQEEQFKIEFQERLRREIEKEEQEIEQIEQEQMRIKSKSFTQQDDSFSKQNINQSQNQSYRSNSHQLCASHQKKFEFLCISCQEQCCVECKSSQHQAQSLGQNDIIHTTHFVVPLEDLWKEIKMKENCLKKLIYRVDDRHRSFAEDINLLHENKIKIQMEQKKQKLFEGTQLLFKGFFDLLEDKRQEVNKLIISEFDKIEEKFQHFKETPQKSIYSRIFDWKQQTHNLLDENCQILNQKNVDISSLEKNDDLVRIGQEILIEYQSYIDLPQQLIDDFVGKIDIKINKNFQKQVNECLLIEKNFKHDESNWIQQNLEKISQKVQQQMLADENNLYEISSSDQINSHIINQKLKEKDQVKDSIGRQSQQHQMQQQQQQIQENMIEDSFRDSRIQFTLDTADEIVGAIHMMSQGIVRESLKPRADQHILVQYQQYHDKNSILNCKKNNKNVQLQQKENQNSNSLKQQQQLSIGTKQKPKIINNNNMNDNLMPKPSLLNKNRKGQQQQYNSVNSCSNFDDFQHNNSINNTFISNTQNGSKTDRGVKSQKKFSIVQVSERGVQLQQQKKSMGNRQNSTASIKQQIISGQQNVLIQQSKNIQNNNSKKVLQKQNSEPNILKLKSLQDNSFSKKQQQQQQQVSNQNKQQQKQKYNGLLNNLEEIELIQQQQDVNKISFGQPFSQQQQQPQIQQINHHHVPFVNENVFLTDTSAKSPTNDKPNQKQFLHLQPSNYNNSKSPKSPGFADEFQNYSNTSKNNHKSVSSYEQMNELFQENKGKNNQFYQQKLKQKQQSQLLSNGKIKQNNRYDSNNDIQDDDYDDINL